MCQKHQRRSSVVFPYCANIDSPRGWWKQQVHKFMTYALLDDQSDTCFIKQTAVDKLGVSGPEVHLKLSTVLAQQTIWCIRKATYTREIIPGRHSRILRPETARKWPHFQGSSRSPDAVQWPVSLLLGINYARAIKPREITPGGDDDLYAKRNALKWGGIGMVRPNASELEEEGVEVNRIVKSC